MSSGLRWEEEVANYLEARGLDTDVRKTVSGHEIDVYARKDQTVLVVECKDWERPVSPDAVRQVNSVAEDLDVVPAIAYTSELSEGAQTLTERWGIIVISPDVVRGTATSIDDLETLAESQEIALPSVIDLTQLKDPLGAFQVSSDFAKDVATTAVQRTLEPFDDESWLEHRIRDLLETREADVCVPILRHDQGTLELYFITETPTDALPEAIHRETIRLD